MNRSKAIGTRGESSVRDFLQSEGFDNVERRALSGALDRGDISGLPGVVVEVKSQKSMALAEWVDEAEQETKNDGADFGVVWHKRRGRSSPAAWYVTMTGATFVHVLKKLLTARESND